jgi:hypothetical protein
VVPSNLTGAKPFAATARRIGDGSRGLRLASEASLGADGSNCSAEFLDLIQAASATLIRRRYVMKLIPAKPISSIAHVEGSGTPRT